MLRPNEKGASPRLSVLSASQDMNDEEEVDEWEQCAEDMVNFFEERKYEKLAEEAVTASVQGRRRPAHRRTPRKPRQNTHLLTKLRMSLRVADALQSLKADGPPPDNLGSELREQLSIPERISIHRARLHKSTAWLARQDAIAKSKRAEASSQDPQRCRLDALVASASQNVSYQPRSSSQTSRAASSCSVESMPDNAELLRALERPEQGTILDEWLDAVLSRGRNRVADNAARFCLGTWLAEELRTHREGDQDSSRVPVPPFRTAFAEGNLGEQELQDLLRTLDASVCRLSLRQSLVDAVLLSTVLESTRITVLDLSGCRAFGEQGLAVLEAHFPRLQRLDLSGNGISSVGAQRLASLFSAGATAPALETLELADNALGRDGTIAILQAIARHGDDARLLELGLRNTDLAFEGADADDQLVTLCSRQCDSLRHIDLSDNRINQATAEMLLGELHPRGRLFGVHLDCNPGFRVASHIRVHDGRFCCVSEVRSSASPPTLEPRGIVPLLDRAPPLWVQDDSQTNETAATSCWACQGWQICTFRFWGRSSSGRPAINLHVSTLQTPVRMEPVSGQHQGWAVTIQLLPGVHQFWFSASDAPAEVLMCPGLDIIRGEGSEYYYHEAVLEPREGPFDPACALNICEPSPLTQRTCSVGITDRDYRDDCKLLRAVPAVRNHFAQELFSPPTEAADLDLRLEWDFPGSRDTVEALQQAFRDLHDDLCFLRILLSSAQKSTLSGHEFLELICARAEEVYREQVDRCDDALDVSFASALRVVVAREIKPRVRFSEIDPGPLRCGLPRSTEIGQLLAARVLPLRERFRALARRTDSQRVASMGLSTWMGALSAQSICPLIVSRHQARLVFVQSLAPQALSANRGSNRLTWEDFLEALCRLAAVAWLPGPALQALLGAEPSSSAPNSAKVALLKRASGIQRAVGPLVKVDVLFRADPDPTATYLQSLAVILEVFLADAAAEERPTFDLGILKDELASLSSTEAAARAALSFVLAT